jgi:rRNA maturation RNase YbeY
MSESEVIVVRRNQTPLRLSDAEIEAQVLHALASEQQEEAWVVSIVLVDDPEMQRMHADFMDIDEPTDVMTFPSEQEDGGPAGDIVISVERAAEQGAENGLSTENEVIFLAIHGVLHLTGWDDHAEADRAAMLDRQRSIIAGASQPGEA